LAGCPEGIIHPAIYYAEHGYAVPEIIQSYWADEAKLRRPTKLAEFFFLAVKSGTRPSFTNPDIAKSCGCWSKKGGTLLQRRDRPGHRPHLYRFGQWNCQTC
jgi:gamma-glutamyltranspeptidase